jgi:hypothetical protein
MWEIGLTLVSEWLSKRAIGCDSYWSWKSRCSSFFQQSKVYIINIGYSCLNRDCRDGEGDLKITQVLNLCPPREIQFTANHVIRSQVPITCFIVWTNFSLLLKRQSDYLPGEGIFGGRAESLSYKLRYQLPSGGTSNPPFENALL